MKGYVQWATDEAADWVEFDSADWARFAFKTEPVGGEIIDGNPGYVNAVDFMGTIYSGYDHYAVEDLPDGLCRIIAWIDDADDLAGEAYDEYARVATFWPLAPDAKFGGAVNTRAETIVYANNKTGGLLTELGPVQFHRNEVWGNFAPPDPALTGHGMWLPDTLSDRHFFDRSTHTWRAWSAGVDSKYLDANGWVAAQGLNKPKGTITYFQRDTARATGVHVTDAAAGEQALELTAGAGETYSDNLSGDQSMLHSVWTTPTDEPNDGAWPTGAGAQAYEAQLNASNIGADVTFGLRAAGSATGHFARVNAGLTSDLETNAQTEALFAAPTGLKLASYAGTWTAGAADNRFECLVAATRTTNHGNQALEFTYDSDAFARGPWVVAGAELPELAMAQYQPG